jgi:hypothetical protein
MNTLKTSASNTASVTAKHLDVRLQKIRSRKTSALKPLKIVAAGKLPSPRPAIKSIVPYGLVVAALVLSGVTAGGAHAATTHAKPAQAVTHVARRHALPAQQIDPAAQFFQGWFGAPPVVHTARSRAGQRNYAPYDWSTPAGNSSQQAEEDAQQAAQAQTIQQSIDESNAASAETAAAGAQAAQDSVNAFQFEMSVQNGN